MWVGRDAHMCMYAHTCIKWNILAEQRDEAFILLVHRGSCHSNQFKLKIFKNLICTTRQHIFPIYTSEFTNFYRVACNSPSE